MICIKGRVTENRAGGISRDLCKTSLFAQFLCQAQILILEIFDIFLWLKFSPSLDLNKNKHLSKVSPGYTLLEVTIALIIIGMSLGVLFAQISRSKSLSFKANLVLESVRILHNLTEDSVFIENAVKNDQTEGDVPGENGWSYSIDTRPLEIKLKSSDEPVDIPGMKLLKICIRKGKGNHKEYCITRWYRGK